MANKTASGETPATTTDLITRVRKATGLPNDVCKAVILQTFVSITELANELPGVKVRDFGVFEIRYRNGRQNSGALNGAGGVHPHEVLAFKAAKSKRTKVDY